MHSPHTTHETAYSGDPHIHTSPVKCQWTHTADHDPAEPTSTTKRCAGARTELARYTTPRGQRLLVGQRIDGEPCLIDMPAGDHGRVHLVERGLTGHDELQAIVADYIDQSTRRGEPAIIARSDSDLTAQLHHSTT
jgi:hypothetical protein